MAKYLDTGAGDPAECVGCWLEQNARRGIRGFRCQFGYFRFGAIEAFADLIRDAARDGYPVRFVLGSNGGSLAAQDVQLVLRVAHGPRASIRVVAYADAEFHPKTVHMIKRDNSAVAIVGSSNLTGSGLGKNVEASIALDSQDVSDQRALKGVADAVERWQKRGKKNGVYKITSDNDIRQLIRSRIINQPQPEPRLNRAAGAGGSKGKLARRGSTWRPSRKGWRPVIPPLFPRPSRAPVPRSSRASAASSTGVPPWTKRLTPTEAQRNVGHKTRNVRLTQALQDIDHETWFREVFFAGLPWEPIPSKRRGRRRSRQEFVYVPFDIIIHGEARGQYWLKVDHDPNRALNQRKGETQSGVPTWLKWGKELGEEMEKRTDYEGDLLVLTRHDENRFTLEIREG